jgi:hypothetical protein
MLSGAEINFAEFLNWNLFQIESSGPASGDELPVNRLA